MSVIPAGCQWCQTSPFYHYTEPKDLGGWLLQETYGVSMSINVLDLGRGCPRLSLGVFLGLSTLSMETSLLLDLELALAAGTACSRHPSQSMCWDYRPATVPGKGSQWFWRLEHQSSHTSNTLSFDHLPSCVVLCIFPKSVFCCYNWAAEHHKQDNYKEEKFI